MLFVKNNKKKLANKIKNNTNLNENDKKYYLMQLKRIHHESPKLKKLKKILKEE